MMRSAPAPSSQRVATARAWGRATSALGLLLGAGILAVAAAAVAVPQLPRGALVEARTALAEGRVDDALVEFQRLAAQYPRATLLALWHGHAWRTKGDRPAATREYLRALELAPNNAQALLALGDMQDDAGNLVQAAGYYERAIEVAPQFILAHRKAAATEVQRLRHGAAIQHLQAFLELQGDDIEALNVLGIEQFLNEDHDAAIETFERVLQIEPDNGKAHFGLGMVLSDRSAEHDKALVHLRRAIDADPSNPTAHYLLGRVLIVEENVEEALVALQRSLELSPDLADAHYRIALLYARLGDRQAARRHQESFQQLSRAQDDLEARETRLGVLRNAASAALTSGDPEAFQQAVDELLQADPDNPGVLTLSAQGALAAGDLERGLADISRALRFTPDQWEALYVQGLLLRRAGRPEQALASLRRVVERNPLFADGYAVLGNVLLDVEDTEGAVDAFRSAVRTDPEQPAHYLNLATVYQQLGLAQLEAEAMANYRRLSGGRQ